MQHLKPFLVKITLLTALLGGLLTCGITFGVSWVHPYATALLLFNALLALWSFWRLQTGMHADAMAFYKTFMVNVLVRMGAVVGLFLAYLLLLQQSKAEKLVFTLNFFALYLSYTVFEIINLMPKLRQNSQGVLK